MIWCVDAEVFKHDTLVVFKKLTRDEWVSFHNDHPGVRRFLSKKRLLVGFNIKHYDQFILRAMQARADNRMVKEINDFIIAGNYGWEHWYLRQHHTPYMQLVDVRDDMQLGLSLKAIEGHLGLPIRESTVGFDIDRALTDDELVEVEAYCRYDVELVEKLFQERESYLRAKIHLGKRVGMDSERALGMTNAKITAAVLQAKRYYERTDERAYVVPPNVDIGVLPKEILEFYGQLYDPAIESEDLFKKKVNIPLSDDVVMTYGFGGIHQGLVGYTEGV